MPLIASYALVCVGCSSDLPSSAVARSPGSLTVADIAPSSPNESWTTDDESARVAREEVPGFAGHILDAEGNSVVLVSTEAGRAAAIQYAARQRRQMHLPARQAQVRLVRYDFSALKAWNDKLLPFVGANDFVLLDIDESANRLHLGGATEAALAALRIQAAALMIPADAMQLDIVLPPARRSLLSDRAPAMMGGYQTYVPGTGWCSIGFNAMWGTKKGFLAASHCSYLNQIDSATVYQPNLVYNPDGSAANGIATEVWDRPLDLVCNCRYSDAAFYQYNSIGAVGFDYAIALTTRADSGFASTLQVDASPTGVVGRFPDSYALVGYRMFKTGVFSGRTYGTVTGTCVAIGSYRCQWIGKIFSQDGDSGSPVYDQNYFGQYAQAHGILWGGPPGDFTTSYWSPMSGIDRDLGHIGVCGVSGC